MTQQEINYILTLIADWAAELESDRLNEQCRRSGIDFFSYMKSKGVKAAYMASLIEKETGYHPAKLWSIDDAELLRDAIFRYEGAIETDKRTDLSAKESVDHMWKESRRW